MIEALLTNPYAALGAVLVPCFVGYVTWRNNFMVRRAAACAAFRSAVLRALEGLYPHTVTWPNDINATLKNVFPALASAVSEFRLFVPWYRRRAFDRAWFDYHHGTGRDCDSNYYIHYTDIGDPLLPHDGKKTFYDNVSKVLSFAQQTYCGIKFVS